MFDFVKNIVLLFIEPRYLSPVATLTMVGYITLIFCIIFLVNKIVNVRNIELGQFQKKKRENPFLKEFNLKNTLFQELNRKYKITPVYFSKEKLQYFSLEGFLIINILSAVVFFLFITLLIGNGMIFSVIPGVAVGVLITFFIVNIRYENRKRAFEKTFPDMGAAINQNIRTTITRKEIPELFQILIELDKYPVSEEFTLIAKDFHDNNDIQRALGLIIERYPDSQYLPRIKDFFEIYYDERTDISDLIELTINQIQNFEESKRRVEIELSPYINMIYSIAGVGYFFLTIYLFTNDLTRKFYTSKTGMVTFIIANLFMFIGIFFIQYLKMEVTKDVFMPRKQFKE